LILLVYSAPSALPTTGCTPGQLAFVQSATAGQQLYTQVSGSGGSSTVNVNGSAISNPNLNRTTPAAGTAYQNAIWQVSGSNVSVEVPTTGGTSVKNLYYAPAAKTINGVGASVYQCNSSCGIPTAIASGSTVTASYHAAIPSALTTSSFWDQFVIPTAYANSAITIEVMARSADNTSGHTGSVTFTSAQVGANRDISNPTLGNSTAITITPSSTSEGLVIVTGTFTPSWTAGNVAMWKAVAALGTLTSDLEIVSVRFYATF
jgi:hypothetical protein